MNTPYQILGEQGIRDLANAFYDAMDELEQASEIRKMHGQSLAEIKVLLADFLTEWMGGPARYSDKTGTICLTDPHKPYAIGEKERDQWLLCFERALDKVDAPAELRAMLADPIFRIAETVRNQ